jgi:hypothetical protein
MIGLALAAVPAPTPAPSGSSSGTVNVTIPLVAGVNDGGGSGGTGGGSGGGGSGGGQGGGGSSAGGGGKVCTVITPPAAPVPPSTPTTGAALLVIKPSQAAQGSHVSVRLAGFEAGEKVQLVSYPGARVLGNVMIRADGTLDSVVLIPSRLPIGTVSIEATGWLDCRVGNGTLFVVSPSGSGFSFMPWGLWIIAISGLTLAGIFLLFATQLGWLTWLRGIRRFA